MNREVDRLEEERAEQLEAATRLYRSKSVPNASSEDLKRWKGKINAQIDEKIRAILATQRHRIQTAPSPSNKRPRVTREEDSASAESSTRNPNDGDIYNDTSGSTNDSDTDDENYEVEEAGKEEDSEEEGSDHQGHRPSCNSETEETSTEGSPSAPANDQGLVADDLNINGEEDTENGSDPNVPAAQTTNSASQDEDDFDLQQAPDPEIEKERIRKSKLSMAMQGFLKAKGSQKRRSKGEGVRRQATIFDPKSVKYHEKIFRKGVCYKYKEKDIDVIVGIKRFVSKKQALGVLIVPFEDTFLGFEEADVDFVADFKPTSHCQVYQHVSILKLKHFVDKAPDIDSLPAWVYEPQTEGDWNRFGYFLDNADGIRRKGKREHMRAVELFSGAGGMHLGLKNAGFTTVAAVDNDKFAIATMRMNCIGTPVFQEDVTSFMARHSDRESRELLGTIAYIAVTSPCQGFSGANRNGGQHDKRNNDLSLAVIEAARLFRPPAITFENVLGMWRRKHVHYLKNIVKELMKLGYQVRVAELRACDYGSAQKRPRLIIFATHKTAPPPKFPPKTHGDEEGLLPYVTVGGVLSGLEDGMDCDGNPLRNTNHATTARDDVVKLKADDLAPAIRASGTPPLHYQHDRCLSVRECAALQDFPTTYRISGSTLARQYKQVGNAVPVELSTKIARAVRDVLAFEYVG